MGILDNNKPQPQMRIIDAYICPDLHVLITRRIGDKGRPPAIVKCTQCNQAAQSQGYNINQALKPMVEWYIPDANELKTLTLNMDTAEFNRFTELVAKGMMISRLIPKEEKNEG